MLNLFWTVSLVVTDEETLKFETRHDFGSFMMTKTQPPSIITSVCENNNFTVEIKEIL